MFESVQLYIDRAQAVKPDFQVTNQNAAAVAELCNRLEGIPLAIELAAARAQVLTPGQMLRQLAHRFDFLVSRRRDGAKRHQTLHAAMDWSYRLLPPELQRFFARLSGFRGGWSMAAAEAVCEEPLALDYLAQLRECSLVLVVDDGEETRFRMLDTLREFAQENLEATGESADLRRQHAEFFLALAENAEYELQGPTQGEWLARLEREHDNLRAALAWLVERREVEQGLRLARALQEFWCLQGFWTEGRERLVALLGLAEGAERTAARANALRDAGYLAYRQHDFEVARALYEESLTIRRELGDKRTIASSLNDLAYMALSQGDWETARTLHEEGLAIWRELGDRQKAAYSLDDLGSVARHQRDYETAQALHGESLAIQRELGSKEGIANSLWNLGLVASSKGDYGAARALHEESLAIYRELGNKGAIVGPLDDLGSVARIQGDYERARAFYEESLAIQGGLGNRWAIANSLWNLGRVTSSQGDYKAARALHEESLAIRRELGNKWGIAGSLEHLGLVARHEGDYAAARTFYEQSLAIWREQRDNAGAANLLVDLGDVALDQGEYERAKALHGESLTLYQELRENRGIIVCLERLSGVANAQGLPSRATRLFGAAEAVREAIGYLRSSAGRADYGHTVNSIRAALGDEAFTAAWEAGRAMTLEQAVAYALEQPSTDPSTQ
jgi:tetratricopeptide (TPR) repeat protein